MKIYISKNTNNILKNYLEGIDIVQDIVHETLLNREIVFIGPIKNVDFQINCHPDILFCKLNDDEVFVGDENQLSIQYPGDIRYNACSTGKYFIHNLKYTDIALLERAKGIGLRLIDVNQGYAKCSIVVVDEDSIITYDEGIASKCEEAGLDVLLITSGNVKLEGYNTGFIGGTSGRIRKEIVFNGDLSQHPDFDRIRDFIEERGLSLKYFTEYELTDIGSIIAID